MLLLLLACTPESSQPQAPDPLDFDEAGSFVGQASLQGVKASFVSGEGADSGEADTGGEDTALDTGEPADTASEESACLAADLDIVQSTLALSLGEVVAYSAPILDLRTNPNAIYQPARLLRYDSAGGCAVLTTFSDADSMEMATGFGSEGPSYGLFAPAGMMARLVDNGSGELWVFLNSAGAFWRVDPSSGAVVRDSTIGWVTGAIEAPGGGAYLSTAPVFDANDTVIEPGALVQLAPPGLLLSSTTLPFASTQTGFGTLDGSDSRRIPMFLSNDIAVDEAGDLYILDSELSELAVYSGGAFTVYGLGLPYPTGVTWDSGGLIIGSGLVYDNVAKTVLTSPALHTWDPVLGANPAMTLSAPSSGWITQGFGSITTGNQVLIKNHWLELEGLGGALSVGDPGHGRVLLVE